MSNIYARETKAGRAFSAWVILNRKGEHVATVNAAFSDGGSCLVNVWNHGDAAARCQAAANGNHGPGDFYFQHARASGYGYDKLTAALTGLWIDGHEMTDHCSTKGAPRKPPAGLKRWPQDAKPKPGYSFANYQSRFITFGFDPEPHEREGFEGNDGYESCFRESGLDYLKARGNRVIQAV